MSSPNQERSRRPPRVKTSSCSPNLGTEACPSIAKATTVHPKVSRRFELVLAPAKRLAETFHFGKTESQSSGRLGVATGARKRRNPWKLNLHSELLLQSCVGGTSKNHLSIDRKDTTEIARTFFFAYPISMRIFLAPGFSVVSYFNVGWIIRRIERNSAHSR